MSHLARFALALAIGVAFVSAAGAQVTPILVIVDSLEADPADAEVLLVVRTATASAFDSGSLILEALDKNGGGVLAFSSVVAAAAYSGAGDATISATLDVPSQRIHVTFESPSGTLNQELGPLLTVRLALQPGLLEDERFDLRVVPGQIDFETASGELLNVLADRGRLRLRPADPGEADLGPLGVEVAPGETAVFGGSTGRPFAIGSGTVELLFDATVADGEPALVIDPRYGSVTIDAIDVATAGRVLVTFTSPGGDLNSELYGMVFAIVLPTHAGTPVGTLANVTIGPATELFDPAGDPLAVEADDSDVLDFIQPDLVLGAGFEFGDLLEFTTAN